MGQREPEPGEVLALEAGLRALHERIAGRFRRPEAHQRTLAYLQGLLGPIERKNGWQLAAYAGDATPFGMQRLLARYRWDEDGVRDDLREYVVEHLGDEQAVLVVDELGFLKQGKKSVGVQRQYSKTAGKVENCQIGLFLAYVSNRSQTFLDRELYLSDDWLWDLERMRETGVPQEIQFLPHRDKHELAQAMIGRALAAGVPFAWVAGDAVRCHGHHQLGWWLEEAGIAPCAGGGERRQDAVDRWDGRPGAGGATAVGPADTAYGLATAQRRGGRQAGATPLRLGTGIAATLDATGAVALAAGAAQHHRPR